MLLNPCHLKRVRNCNCSTIRLTHHDDLVLSSLGIETTLQTGVGMEFHVSQSMSRCGPGCLPRIVACTFIYLFIIIIIIIIIYSTRRFPGAHLLLQLEGFLAHNSFVFS